MNFQKNIFLPENREEFLAKVRLDDNDIGYKQKKASNSSSSKSDRAHKARGDRRRAFADDFRGQRGKSRTDGRREYVHYNHLSRLNADNSKRDKISQGLNDYYEEVVDKKSEKEKVRLDELAHASLITDLTRALNEAKYLANFYQNRAVELTRKLAELLE